MLENADVPVFLISRDRLTILIELVTWLQKAGFREVVVVDNASAYPPLRRWLRETTCDVVEVEHNFFGHRSPWLTGTIQKRAFGRPFIVSDGDVVPSQECPTNICEHFGGLLDRYPEIDKVGFGLRLDDLPAHYGLRDHVRQWEARFWQDEVEPAVFRAPIDTTFALYRAGRSHNDGRALRTGFPYIARHLPWYQDSDHPTAEDRYYRDHADPLISNWDRDRLPVWKQRWLRENTSPTDGPAAAEGDQN